jgi:hypothetical protein
MSEYQYYEFQSIDRRLTERELSELRQLSSRVQLTAHSAIFTYSYGDFRGDDRKVLAKYFDAFLYIANWGMRRLMFRFPKTLVSEKALNAYDVAGAIEATTSGDYTILEITIDKEEGEWVEAESNWLSRMIPLREAIIAGDYRALYLAWLRVLDLLPPELDPDEEDELFDDDFSIEPYDSPIKDDAPEPPVPPNLNKMDSALQAFIEFFEIDPHMIEVAARASATAKPLNEPVEEWIARLPEQEARQFLLRAVQGEPNIVPQVLNTLRQRFATPATTAQTVKPRTAGELMQAVIAHRNEAHEAEQRKREAERKARLEALALRETAVWNQVIALIDQKQVKSYEEAIRFMLDLRELAQYQQQEATFTARIEGIRARYPSLSGLKSRMIDAKLITK